MLLMEAAGGGQPHLAVEAAGACAAASHILSSQADGDGAVGSSINPIDAGCCADPLDGEISHHTP
eukprot:2049256-Pleurochrysis_carterae.AAC.1